MKIFLLAFLLLFAVGVSNAQKQNGFHIPLESSYGDPNDLTLPYWVRLMYQEPVNVRLVLQEYEKYYAENTFIKNQHTQYFKRLLKTSGPFLNRTGVFEEPDWDTWRRESKEAEDRANQSQSVEGLPNWNGIGPFDFDKDAYGRSHAPGSAHVFVTRQSLSSPNILFAGTASSGIWKTVDSGANWVLVSKSLFISQVRAIAIHPTNPDTVYFGGNGSIYRSTNGGSTWSIVGSAPFTSSSHTVYDLMIHPNRTNIVYAATNNGLYRSTNSGISFTQILSASTSKDYFDEIEIHPTNENIVYAIKNAVNDLFTEFYKSTDFGQNFTNKTSWPSNATLIVSPSHQRRAEISVTPASPNLIYALLAGEFGGGSGLYGFYKSLDAGETWTHTCCGTGPGGTASTTNPNILGYNSTGADNGGQYYYDLALQADPSNPNKVHAAGIMHWISLDGGQTFTNTASWSDAANVKYVHADIHDIFIRNNQVWVSCDGGIFLSVDSGKLSFNRRQYGIQGTEFWGFGMGHKDADVMLGGTYHNSHLMKNGNVYQNGWISYTGSADGYRGFVNPGKPKTVYNDSGKDQLVQSRTLPFTRTSYDKRPNAGYFPGESCPLRWDPRSYNHFYSGVDSTLWKTEDDGASWTAIKTFASGKIIDIEVAWSNPNVIYVVFAPTDFYANKFIWKTTDAGKTWTNISLSSAVTNNNSSLAMDLTVSDSSENDIWVGLIHPYNWNNADGNKIFYSSNGGLTYTNWTTTLLNGEGITNIEFYRGSSGGIYVGSRKTVFYRDKTMSNWVTFGTGMPLPTSSVKILPWYLEGKMRNASNRGVFESPVHTLQKPSVQISADKLKSACVRDTLFLVDYSAHYKTGATFFWTITPSPSYISSRSVENPKVVFGSAGSYTVSLVVSDSLGTDSQTINAFYSVTEGCNIDPIPGSALQISADGQRALTAPLNITSNTVTITAWVKPSQIQSDYSGIVMNFASVSSAGGLNVRQNNELGYHWPGGSWWWSSGLTLTPGEWAHVALVITPTSATIYKNGVGRTHTIALSPCEFRELAIGSYRDWTSRTFKGLIDEVCFYNRSLNQAEIRESMHLTKSGIYANNLIAYYQFNENEGFVQDKMGIDHASLVAGAARSSSSVPVAGGVSDRLTINSSNATTFPNTQVTMKFSSTGTNPNGEIVVSRLNYQPDVVPNSQDSMSRYYWVINNFGSNSTFSPMQELWFKGIGFVSPQHGASPSKFSLFKRRSIDDGATWQAFGSADSATAGSSGQVRFGLNSNITSFSQFVFTKGTPTTLPVSWLWFKATPDFPDRVKLDWATATEFNSLRFVVERSSDGQHFDSLGEVPAAGFSQVPSYYRYFDSMPIHGTAYYRIKEVDVDGSISYSKIEVITYKKPASSFTFFPNPSKGGSGLSIDHSYESLSIRIVDAQGRIVFHEKVGAGNRMLATENLATGSYFIVIDDEKGTRKMYPWIIH